MAVLAVLACYALAFRRRTLLLLVLPALVAIRTDLLLLLPGFYVFLWLTRPSARRLIGLSALSSIALYGALNSIFGSYGWFTVFDYTFSHQSAYPADYAHVVTMDSYRTALASGVRSIENAPRLLKYLVAAIAGSAVLLWRPRWLGPSVRPFSACLWLAFGSSLAYTVLHFILFPATWARFFAGQYALVFALATYVALEVSRSAVRTWLPRQPPRPVPLKIR